MEVDHFMEAFMAKLRMVVGLEDRSMVLDVRGCRVEEARLEFRSIEPLFTQPQLFASDG